MTSAEASVTSTDLNSRRHVEALDGLRGVAALCVVLFHFMEMAISDYSHLFIGHGFLAVDFFFCLSGFVIAYAYDDRIRVLGRAEFFTARLIRLHPMVIFGSLLGLISLLLDPLRAHPLGYNSGQLALFFLASVLLIPYSGIAHRSGNIFGLNAPSWSLLWEYLANIVYALVLYRLGRRWLLALLFVAAVLLSLVAFRAGTVSGGWSGGTFWDGGARIAYSFLAGLLVYRSGWRIRSSLGIFSLSILLVASFLMPYWPWNGLAELLVVLIYYPMLIALGAGAALGPRAKVLSLAAGRLSYPLYMTHYSVIWIFGEFCGTRHPATSELARTVTAGVLGMALFAWFVFRLYDLPVRRYLARRFRVPSAATREQKV